MPSREDLLFQRKPNKRVDVAKTTKNMLVKTFLRSIPRGYDLGELSKRSFFRICSACCRQLLRGLRWPV